jgi:hypothetical protein
VWGATGRDQRVYSREQRVESDEWRVEGRKQRAERREDRVIPVGYVDCRLFHKVYKFDWQTSRCVTASQLHNVHSST